MTRRARTLFFTLCAAFCAARFQCEFKMPAFWAESGNLPWQERLLRGVDFILMEPGYGQARTLASEWAAYTQKFANDEKRAAELEMLANEPAILGFIRDPKGPLAPAFETETAEILNGFGNAALKAWRLRTLDDKILFGRDAKRLAALDTTTTRREIGPRYFTIPISGAGFNVSLDAEWDITRLPDFPLSQINSEYLFLTTDHEMNILAIGNPRSIPDSGFRFISGTKFISEAHGVRHGLRIFTTSARDFRLVICYPFAGYLFYAVRGGLALLLIAALIFTLAKIRALRSAASHVMENRSGEWLQQHYEQSLGINEQALNIGEKALGVVSSLKDREAKIIGELGRHIEELSDNFTAQTRLVLEEAAKAQTTTPAITSSAEPQREIRRPLHKKAVHKAPILIDADKAPEIQVTIELDLPLDDEKQLTPEEKTAYIGSLRRRAQEKTGQKDFIRDEKIDNYEYVPPEPMKLPEPAAIADTANTPDTADLEYVQKFRYAGKSRVLPMATPEKKSATLRMREDLHRETLIVAEEE